MPQGESGRMAGLTAALRAQPHPRIFVSLLAASVIVYFFRTYWLPDTHSPLPILQEKQACVQPKLELYPNQAFTVFFSDIPKPQCWGQKGAEGEHGASEITKFPESSRKNWVKIEDGVFKISKFAKELPNITCDYIPILRGKSDSYQSFGEAVKNIQDGSKVCCVASKVKCFAGGLHYENYHLTLPLNESLKRRSEDVKLPKGALGMNVLMFGFDSVSRLAWQRKLPKTYAYMRDVLKCIVLEGYNIVGDGTTAALLPMFTGKTELELPEVRQGYKGATTLDVFPWIWRDFKEAGYVTQWTEDAASGGTFTWRMNGFKEQPMDYHNYHFYAEVEKRYHQYNQYCLGYELRHNVMLNWIEEFLKVYKHGRTFSFGFHTECSHNSNKPLNIVDEDLKNCLSMLLTNGYLDNTVLILMSDHGARFQSIRDTIQGKQEERNPFFSFRLPDWFKKKHPKAFRNLQINSKRLVTPFDIHTTFRHILNHPNISERGISLFSEIPASRTCHHASIEPHWCNCLAWKSIASNSPTVLQAAQAFIELANSLTSGVRERCHLLEVDEIHNSVELAPEKGLLKFRRLDVDARKLDMTDETKSDVMLYQFTIYTKPGGGHFEVTVRRNLNNNSFTLDRSDVSRVNRFGNAPRCILPGLPNLAWYCVCK